MCNINAFIGKRNIVTAAYTVLIYKNIIKHKTKCGNVDITVETVNKK